MNPDEFAKYISWGQATLQAEAQAINDAGQRLGEDFALAVATVLKSTGKVVVSGLGKSGHVARKIASTLSSTGTPAFFLHPGEALHGDFGMVQSTDSVLAIAFGGETQEVIEVAKFSRRLGIPVIAITGKKNSTLGEVAHIVLDGGITREADPLGLAPTASSTLAMALGDALAVALMRARGFSSSDFAALHPGGSLGRRLSTVADHMQGLAKIGCLAEQADFHQILESVTKSNFGIAAIVRDKDLLVGAISDGDLRRALLQRQGQALAASAAQLMSRSPRCIGAKALAIDALNVMNEKQITQLFVVDPAPSLPGGPIGGPVRLLGLVRLHDLLAAKIV